jgi:YD repeat-containing protein
MTLKTFKWAALSLPLLAATACTLDEPSDSVSADSRLSSVTCQGTDVVTYAYDSHGRLSKITWDVADIELNISYDPLTIKVRYYDYDYTWDEASGYYIPKRYLTSFTKFSDITLNTHGYVTSATCTDESYGEDGTVYNSETDVANFTYNVKNQLISSDIDEVSYQWDSNGDMVYVADNSDDHADPISVAYSTTLNSKGQWSPMWVDCFGLCLTGYFGVAPVHLPSAITDIDDNTTTQLSYKLNSAGYIIGEMVYDSSEGEGMTLTYHYKKLDTSAFSSAPSAKSATTKAPAAKTSKRKSRFMFHKK